MKFEKDFDFETANAQFNKEEIDREFQSKLKLKGQPTPPPPVTTPTLVQASCVNTLLAPNR